MARHHPASHAARKGISGSPHTKGMPEGYLAGHSEDHLNAHNTHAGKLMRTHENLHSRMAGSHSEPHTAMDSGPGKATEDEESEC